MNTKLVISLVVIVAVLAVAGCFLPVGEKGTVVERVVGAAAGPDVSYRTFFRSGVTAGGVVSTTTTASTYTTSARDFAGTPSLIEWLPNASLTLTINATSTYEYVPNVGDTATVIIHNASTTSGAITLAAENANVDLVKDEDVADLVINANDYGVLTLIRRASGVVGVAYTNFVAAD